MSSHFASSHNGGSHFASSHFGGLVEAVLRALANYKARLRKGRIGIGI